LKRSETGVEVSRGEGQLACGQVGFPGASKSSRRAGNRGSVARSR